MFNFVPFENENAYICDLISYSDSLKEFSNNSFKSTSDDEKLQDKKEEKIETKDEKCPIIFIALNLEENKKIEKFDSNNNNNDSNSDISNNNVGNNSNDIINKDIPKEQVKVQKKLNFKNEVTDLINNSEKTNDTSSLTAKKYKKNKSRSKNRKKSKTFSFETIRRRIKNEILRRLLIFINKKIKLYYNNKINEGKGILIKQLLDLNQDQTSNSKVQFYKEFLNKKIKDIFSEKICDKYTCYPKNHNKDLIDKLINENSDFIDLFNLTFLDCLKYFRGSEEIKELDGMGKMDDKIFSKEEEDDNDDYKKNFIYMLNNYEKNIQNKKPRNKIKSKDNDIES